ncbi:hypothetical protein K435DRAFT_239748 [Dendrothele bispora CBS 962.96]|uniref:Uncharacterized protein n=1 Tax=Dendrothele bispora (strain CBS 962.96) TaxID=1314807 RepID=A0A4S8MLT0_DENBC|nr:hypothetical protein K435DRAFT_239748 [Dendrothele bispora CBS 962.96]
MMESAFVGEPSSRPRHDRAKSHDLHDAILDPSIPPPEPESDNLDDGYAASIDSSNRWSNQGSLHAPTEFELLSPSGEVTRVYLPSTPTYPPFHLPIRQNRQQSFPGYHGDTSDTPSLMSSTSRSSYSSLHTSPISPGVTTPVDYPESVPLPAIRERQFESHELENNWPVRSPVAISTQRPHDPWPKQKSMIDFGSDDTTTLKDSRIGEPKPTRPLLPPLVVDDNKPSSIVPISSESETSPVTFASPRQLSASPTPFSASRSPPVLSSPVTSPPPMSASPLPASPSLLPSSTQKEQSSSSFTRFLKKKSTEAPASDSKSIKSAKSQDKLDAKAVKAQEKKWKKEVAKARTENLAAQLKESARKREQAAADATSTRSSERKKKGDDAAMWGGMVGML